MRCAHCKDSHDTVLEVRRCSGVFEPINVTNSPAATPYPKATPVSKFRETANRLPNVPKARYAIRSLDFEKGTDHYSFYVVEKPTQGRWEGYTFIRQQAGSEYFSVPFGRSLPILEAIAHDPEEALRAYGRELGECGVCGRTLTNPESIAAGIGPICAGRL